MEPSIQKVLTLPGQLHSALQGVVPLSQSLVTSPVGSQDGQRVYFCMALVRDTCRAHTQKHPHSNALTS